jgi:hypothetical protein
VAIDGEPVTTPNNNKGYNIPYFLLLVQNPVRIDDGPFYS